MLTAFKDPMSDVFGKDLKICYPVKIEVDGEIEGGWGLVESKKKCRACGEILILVPRESHANSKFWVNEQPDGLSLLCCPDGCSVEMANETMDHYLGSRGYCKNGSESFAFDLDLAIVLDCWIEPSGKVHPVEPRGHLDYAAVDLDRDHIELEESGWFKITRPVSVDAVCIVIGMKKPTRYQVQSIIDICQAHNGKTEDFMRQIEGRGGVCANIGK